MNVLPRVESNRTYRKVFGDDAVWGPAFRTICARHGLDASQLRRADLGSHIVFFCGDRIIKLFCPIWPNDFVAEQGVLAAGVEGVPIPELLVEDELEGWRYIVITVVPGVPALRVWRDLDVRAQTDVIDQLGALMQALHRTPPVAALETDWAAFLQQRQAALDNHHRSGGEPWQALIRERVADFSPPPFEPVLLSADITADHVLLSERNGRCEITGFIDFGDAMMGDRHYEFIAPLAFFTNGAPELSQRLVRAYGWEPIPELTARLTTYCLLHRYGHIGMFLERSPADDMSSFHRGLWGGV